MLERAVFSVTDISVSNWLHEHATAGVTATMRAITVLGWPPFVIVLTSVAILLLLRRRDLYAAALLGLCVGGGMLINTGLKNVFDRTRPHFEPTLANAYGHSFPSGHVAAASLLYGCAAVLAWRRLPTWPARTAVVSTLFLLVQSISLSRIYLGVHYLTDVLAAQALGVIWLAFSFTAVEIFRRRRLAASRSAPPAGTSQ